MKFKNTMPLIIFLVLLIAPASFAEEKGSSTKKMNSSADSHMDEMMAKMMAYTTPGDEHAVLNNLVGTWNHKVLHWMSPDAEPEETTGTSEAQWIMDGRFVQQSVSGNWNNMPFNGMGIFGYNKITQKYNSLWLDNMSTGIMQSTGEYSADTKSISEQGRYSCPMTGTVRTHRSIVKIIDDNTYTHEMFTTDPDGKEFRSMLIEYTRVKN